MYFKEVYWQVEWVTTSTVMWWRGNEAYAQNNQICTTCDFRNVMHKHCFSLIRRGFMDVAAVTWTFPPCGINKMSCLRLSIWLQAFLSRQQINAQSPLLTLIYSAKRWGKFTVHRGVGWHDEEGHVWRGGSRSVCRVHVLVLVEVVEIVERVVPVMPVQVDGVRLGRVGGFERARHQRHELPENADAAVPEGRLR